MLLVLKAITVRFSYRNGDTMLLVKNIYRLTNKGYVFYKDHSWLRVTDVKIFNNKKNKQGKYIYFLAKEYIYKDFDLSDKIGLKIKYPDKVVIMSSIQKTLKGRQMKARLRFRTNKGAVKQFIVPIKPLLEELNRQENKSEYWIEDMRPRLSNKYKCSELVVEEQIAPHLFNQYIQ